MSNADTITSGETTVTAAVSPRKTATIAAIILLLVVGASVVHGDPSEDRLPRDTEPLAYGLRLVPNYDKSSDQYTFGGHVEIWIRVNAITPDLTLHAKDIQIKSVAIVEVRTQTALEVDGHDLFPDTERLVIYANQNLLAGRQYQVRILFQGLLRTDMTGFYRSVYNEDDQFKWMAVMQFKPTYARRAFPCYDEPEYKTPFNISLGRQENQMTVSVSELDITQRLQYYGYWLDHYKTTPPISTYMVAGLIGELQKSEQMNSSNVNVTIFTYNDYLSQTDYAKTETPALIETMENFTGIEKEMNKMDYIAIPDFDEEGVEGVGLNLYRERYVLFDDESKTKFKERSTMVIQQQQSHHWFGTLVTCSRWDFMWLNEGFARYFQYFATAIVKTKWRLEELFVVEQHQTALEYDQTPRHPMTWSVKSPDDILNMIDKITFNKAAALLRMLKYIVTDDNFHEPLKLYLQSFKYDVVSPSDLWAVYESYYFDIKFKLTENVPFTNFALSWTDQSGYPVINVVRNENTYEITQKRFSIWPTNDTATKWYIALTYTDNNANNFEDLTPVNWLHPHSSITYIHNTNISTWTIFNLQSTGFYRVNYDKDNWNQLVQQLKTSHRQIHVLNRAQLVDDSFNLARAGLVEYSTALDLSTYLNNEDDCIPWYSAIECLTYVVERMRRSPEGYNYIREYVRNLAESIYTKTENMILQFNSKDHTTITSWNKFSVWACYLDGENCINYSMGNFKKWIMGEKISPEIKDASFCTGIKIYNDTETWKGMFNVYVTTKSFSEKNSAQLALACSQDPRILYKYLDFIFDSNNNGPVRLQDYKDICNAMSLTPQGIEALTNFLLNNMEKILRTILSGELIVTHTYRILASKVALDSEILKLYKLKNAPGLPPRIKVSFDESYVQVEQNLLWYSNYHVSINQWTGAPMDPTTTESETTTTPITLPSTSSPETSSPTTSASETPNTTTATTSSPDTASPTANSTVTKQPTMTTFDFDETTHGTIIRCQNDAPVGLISPLVVIGVGVATLVLNLLAK